MKLSSPARSFLPLLAVLLSLSACKAVIGDKGRPTTTGGGGPAPGSPVILRFTAAPPSLPAAGQGTLTWQVLSADNPSLSIDHGVGAVSGGSVAVTVSETTIYTLTASNAQGSTQATTAVVIGQNPSSRSNNRQVAMVSPTGGESFIAPAALRLTAWGYDPNIATNDPVEGLGNNASKVQFFVDDGVVLEVDGANAEFSVFKGFSDATVAAGTHRVWARAIYTNPADVLDSEPEIITVDDPPAYGQTIDLDADVTLSGSMAYALAGTADRRIRLNGNGHRIVAGTGWSGAFSLAFVDVFDLGQRQNTAETAIDVSTTGDITVEDCTFDGSNTLHFGAGGSAAVSFRRNLLRSNMRMPIGQFPDGQPQGGSYPSLQFDGASTGVKVFAANNVGAGWVEFNNVRGWLVGGDTDADSNVLIGPRVGIHPSGEVQVRRNYSHHVYYGGWSQGNNFDLGDAAGAGIVVEHNVIFGSSWPVRGVGGEFRYNLVLDAGHEWLWATKDGAAVHHNIFLGGDADIGGIYVLYSPTNVRIFNNTIDGLGKITHAMEIDNGDVSLTSNLFVNVPSPGVSMGGGTLTADYNLFYQPALSYADGRKPAHDKTGVDPQLTDPPATVFDLDEVGVWKRSLGVSAVLGTYRMRYTPKPGSPLVDTGDPAGGAGNDIGAVGAGAANADDKFGIF